MFTPVLTDERLIEKLLAHLRAEDTPYGSNGGIRLGCVSSSITATAMDCLSKPFPRDM